MTDSHTGNAKGVRKRETLRTPFVIGRKLGAVPQEGEGVRWGVPNRQHEDDAHDDGEYLLRARGCLATLLFLALSLLSSADALAFLLCR